MNEQAVFNQQMNAALAAEFAEHERARPFVLMRPKIFKDGNQWCALYGDNLMEGVAGFGLSPKEAAANFDKAWSHPTNGI